MNSAIAKPEHGETLFVSSEETSAGMYAIRGYAYAGGGRRINRVELSFDHGHTWMLADV